MHNKEVFTEKMWQRGEAEARFGPDRDCAEIELDAHFYDNNIVMIVISFCLPST